MQPRPAIAILPPGILTALGLKSILEKLIPMAEVDAFDDARALEESGMERYFHFFVATRCFVGHSALFAPVRKRVILLTSGQPQPEFAGFRCLDILRPEGDLIRDIMRMHHGAHHGDHTEGIPPQPQTAQLSAREAGVLEMLCERMGEVVPSQRILQRIWGDDTFFNARSLHVFITRLRRLLSADPSVRIVNARGVGYRLHG